MFLVTPGLTRGLPCLFDVEQEEGGSRVKPGMTNVGKVRSPPQSRHRLNRSFLHYPAVPAFIRLFHLSGKSGRVPVRRGGACRAPSARRKVRIGARMRLNFTELWNIPGPCTDRIPDPTPDEERRPWQLFIPKPPLALLILHRHRNPPTIIPIVERRDLQPAAEAELQPAIDT